MLTKERRFLRNNTTAGLSREKSRFYALILVILTMFFAVRVVGQLVTLFFPVKFLPPFDRWYSGVIPYPLLFPIQLMLLALMLKIAWDVYQGKGYFTARGPRMARILKVLSYAYALIMIGRYALMMILHPELRWFTATTPIWFHFVLAAFLYMLGSYYASLTAEHPPSNQH